MNRELPIKRLFFSDPVLQESMTKFSEYQWERLLKLCSNRTIFSFDGMHLTILVPLLTNEIQIEIARRR